MVIEDCAESVTAKYKGRCTGTWGDVGCFSFQASKQMSLGDGGMATARDEEVHKAIANHAGAPTFLCVAHSMDFNYRMNEQTAAIGLAQLETLPETMRRLQANARLYDEAVEGCKWITLQRGPEGAEHGFYHWAATFAGDEHGLSLDAFTAAVESADLSSITVGYTRMPAYRHPVFTNRLAHAFHTEANRACVQAYEDGRCPVAERIIPRFIVAYVMEPEETAKREAEGLNRVIRQLDKG